jgi:Leucine-rich repeat (LRR) protein
VKQRHTKMSNVFEYINSLPENTQRIRLERFRTYYLPSLERFKNLKILHCSGNEIEFLPKLPDTLIELICPNNKLIGLPQLPDTLKFLDCSNNELTKLPQLPNTLKSLDCSYNLLTDLPKLPNTLKSLSCHINKLTILPQLPNKFKSLICYKNQLTEIPNLPDTLKFLICNYNKITTLPELPNTLKHFCCLDNNLPFEDIESWRTFNKFKSTFYKLKYGHCLERYYIKNIRNKCINKEVIDLVYSPDYNFYKRLLDPTIIKMFC